jgi:hypothetical protein
VGVKGKRRELHSESENNEHVIPSVNINKKPRMQRERQNNSLRKLAGVLYGM